MNDNKDKLYQPEMIVKPVSSKIRPGFPLPPNLNNRIIKDIPIKDITEEVVIDHALVRDYSEEQPFGEASPERDKEIRDQKIYSTEESSNSINKGE